MVIFQPTAVTDVKGERERVMKGGTELFDYQILVNCKMDLSDFHWHMEEFTVRLS